MMMGLTRNLIYEWVPFGSFMPPPHPLLLGPWATQIISHGLRCKTYTLEQGHIGEYSPTDSPHGGIPLCSIQVYTHHHPLECHMIQFFLNPSEWNPLFDWDQRQHLHGLLSGPHLRPPMIHLTPYSPVPPDCHKIEFFDTHPNEIHHWIEINKNRPSKTFEFEIKGHGWSGGP